MAGQAYCTMACGRPRFSSWVGKIRWRRDRLPTPVFLGFPCGSAGKESACNVGDLGSIPGLGRSPGEGKGYPLQFSGLENSMDCVVHGVTKSRTWLSDFHFTMWDLPRPGIKPISLALAGGFFTSELPGKPLPCLFFRGETTQSVSEDS